MEVDKLSKTVKNLNNNVDGIGKSTGLEAEQFFYSSFCKDLKLANILKTL